VAAVQESIERTGDVAQTILRKIKDRYPVRLALSTTHIRSIISGRLVKRKPGADQAILGIHELYRSLFPSFVASLRELQETYPVHPATIALLDGLGDLFSQHRGIVDFVHARVAGDERRGIPSILGRPAAELLGPDSIYEHFAPRLMEFSAFYAYPRHIVPHLDEVIDRVLAEEADRILARRVVRMLVLYRIHPTAAEPDCAHLVELAACSLDFRSLELSARFLAEAILDPVAAASSFLVRSSGPGGDPTRAVYAIATEEDPARVLGERVKRTASELRDADSRLLTDPLSALPESEAWPGRAAMEREQTVLRDSPAARFFPAAKVSICAACADVYAGMLEGDGVIMPPTAAPIPCDYHSERVTPPMPFAEAMRLANAQSAADGEEIA